MLQINKITRGQIALLPLKKLPAPLNHPLPCDIQTEMMSCHHINCIYQGWKEGQLAYKVMAQPTHTKEINCYRLKQNFTCYYRQTTIGGKPEVPQLVPLQLIKLRNQLVFSTELMF